MYKIIDYFYKNSQLNHTILVFFLILGIFSYINIPKEVFPTTQLEKLDIEGSYSGASAESLNNFAVSEIEVDIKKSQYRNGQSDISDLNNAIMKKNLLEDSKMNLKLNKVIYENDTKKLKANIFQL